MKKLMFFAIIIMATTGAFAQASFGVKAGANLANVTGDDIEGSESIFGGYAGFLASLPLNEIFSVQPEVLYSMEGAKDKDFDEQLNLGFVNIPVLLKYNNPSGFFAELGPQLGILTSAKIKSGGSSLDVKDSFKSTNFSVNFGAGYNFTPAIGAGLRYSLGLSNISDDAGGDMKTSTFSFGLHYNFGK